MFIRAFLFYDFSSGRLLPFPAAFDLFAEGIEELEFPRKKEGIRFEVEELVEGDAGGGDYWQELLLLLKVRRNLVKTNAG